MSLPLTKTWSGTQTGGRAPSRKHRLAPIDGMRGYAVFLVFLVHHHSLFGSWLLSGFAAKASAFSHNIGNSGVDMFFLMSGYLIYGNLMRQRTSIGSFLWRRARRIYPAFACVLLIYTLLSVTISSVSKFPHGWGAAIYFVQNALLLPGILPIRPVVTVAWSLSYEALFYISIPFVVRIVRNWSRLERVWLFLAILAVHFVGYQLGYVPHIRMSLFTTGVLLYEAIESKSLRLAKGPWAIACYTGMLMVLGFSWSPHDLFVSPPALWTAGLAFSLFWLTFECVERNGIATKFFSYKPFQGFGRMSYSYFLIHGLVLDGVLFALKQSGVGSLPLAVYPLFLVANFGLTVAVSYLLFRIVEEPLSLNTERNKRAVAQPSPPKALVAASGVGLGMQIGE